MSGVSQDTQSLANAIEFFNIQGVDLQAKLDEVSSVIEELKGLKTALHIRKVSTEKKLESDDLSTGLGNLSAEEVRLLKDIESKSQGLSVITGLENISGDLSSIRLQMATLDEASKKGWVSQKEYGHSLEALQEEYDHIDEITKSLLRIDLRPDHLMKKANDVVSGSGVEQAKGVVSGVMGLMSSLRIAGGLFGLMMYGFTQTDRIRAEAGEMTNILQASGQTVSSAVRSHFSVFQEKVQSFYGIARQEVQGIVNTFIQAGLTADDILSVTHKSLGEVGQDAMTITLGLDKLFELGSGTSASLATQLVTQHGASLESAIDQITRLEFAGSRAGVGVSEFTQFAVQSASELRNYGISADEVAGGLLALQGHYIAFGLSQQTAMFFSQQGMSEIAGGIQGLNLGVKSYLGETLGLGSGVDASVHLQDQIASGDSGQLAKIINALNYLAQRETSGTSGHYGSDEMRQRAYLESIGMGFDGARAIVNLAKLHGTRLETKSLEPKEWEELRYSFLTESQKVSENLRNIQEVLKGMSKVGTAILHLIVDFAGLLIISIKGIMASTAAEFINQLGSKASEGITGAFKDLTGWDISDQTARSKIKSEMDQQIKTKWDQYFGSMSKDFGQIIEGTEDASKGMGKLVLPLVKPILTAFKALGGDVGDVADKLDSVVTTEVDGVPAQPKSSTAVEQSWVKVSKEEVKSALRDAWSKKGYGEADESALNLMTAQIWLESGGSGRLMNYNLGGMKGKGSSGLTVLAKTHEVENGVSVQTKDWFRAYKSLDEAIDNYVGTLHSFKKAFSVLSSGHATDDSYAAALKEGRYMTASAESYANLLGRYNIYMPRLATTEVQTQVVATKVDGKNHVTVTTSVAEVFAP
jgi:hypothetical protein